MHQTNRSFGGQVLRLTAAVGLVLFGGARAAQAQWGSSQPNAQLVFEWQGQVDRETQIDIGSGNVSVHGVTSQESRGRFVNRGSLPRGSGTLYVQRVDGRGSVDVVQQPGYNGDGIVRIQDPQGGVGYYDVRVYWQPSGGTTAGRSGGRRSDDGTWGSQNRRDDRNGNADVVCNAGNGRGHGYGRCKGAKNKDNGNARANRGRHGDDDDRSRDRYYDDRR